MQIENSLQGQKKKKLALFTLVKSNHLVINLPYRIDSSYRQNNSGAVSLKHHPQTETYFLNKLDFENTSPPRLLTHTLFYESKMSSFQKKCRKRPHHARFSQRVSPSC